MGAKRVAVKENVLSANDRIAAANRERFQDAGILAVNLISSPGSGKTMLLERTVERMKAWLNVGIVAGDVQTRNDADRLVQYGVPVEAIETGGSCHLNAEQLGGVLGGLPLQALDLVFVENVGNLVCPSSFDLGESMKIVLMSVTEGEDKPLKYPAAFRRSSALVLTKADLLPHVRFSVDTAVANALSINPALRTFVTSAYTEQGLQEWMEWLTSQVPKH